jgi:hypothetical protein
MTRRVVVSVATDHYVKGQNRMAAILDAMDVDRLFFRGTLPEGCPPHSEVQYAFKAHALAQAADLGFETLIWADACIYPLKSLDALFEKIESEGAWISENGYTNAEWTADSAYPDLFREEYIRHQLSGPRDVNRDAEFVEKMRPVNRLIPHVVATAFGLSVNHRVGNAILVEYERLAKETKAFCGPWTNANYQEKPLDIRPLMGERCQPCGPTEVRGHRHDQTALSVLAHKNGVKLTQPPEWFSYGRADEAHDPRTVLLADGAY